MTDATLSSVGTLPSRRRKARFGRLDVALAFLAIACLAYLVWRTVVVLDYRWRWDAIWPFLLKRDPATGTLAPNLLLQGFMTTIRLAVYGIVMAAAIGTLMGLARTSSRLLPRLIAGAYVHLVRNIPPVVFVFIFVFFISNQIMPALGIGAWAERLGPTARWWLGLLVGEVRLIENFAVGLFCLGLFCGAYVTEIVRAGIQSVPRSQIEAGQSLGLSRLDLVRDIVLPQAMRNVLPPLANQFIQLIKDSSLVSLVSIQELSFMAVDVQVTTQRVFEVFLFTAVLYFVICGSLSLLFARLERRGSAARR